MHVMLYVCIWLKRMVRNDVSLEIHCLIWYGEGVQAQLTDFLFTTKANNAIWTPFYLEICEVSEDINRQLNSFLIAIVPKLYYKCSTPISTAKAHGNLHRCFTRIFCSSEKRNTVQRIYPWQIYHVFRILILLSRVFIFVHDVFFFYQLIWGNELHVTHRKPRLKCSPAAMLYHLTNHRSRFLLRQNPALVTIFVVSSTTWLPAVNFNCMQTFSFEQDFKVCHCLSISFCKHFPIPKIVQKYRNRSLFVLV